MACDGRSIRLSSLVSVYGGGLPVLNDALVVENQYSFLPVVLVEEQLKCSRPSRSFLSVQEERRTVRKVKEKN